LSVLDGPGFAEAVPQLCDLFARTFGRTITPQFLRWRYLENPTSGVLAAIAKLDGELVASYSASPVNLVQDDQLLRVALSMTTMTDPRFAGRGLFTTLAGRVYERMLAEHYHAVIGFPNTNSYAPFMRRLAWKPIYEIPTMTVSITSHHRRDGMPAGVERDDQFLLAGYDQLRSDKLIATARSLEYLQWRYARHPTNRYRTYSTTEAAHRAYCVLKSYGPNAIDVVDLRADDPATASVLLAAVMSDAVQNDAAVVNAWGPRHHFLHSSLAKSGFVNGAPVTYFGAHNFGNVAGDRLFDFNNWYIQMGDSDVY
jgi:hypothetical protein